MVRTALWAKARWIVRALAILVGGLLLAWGGLFVYLGYWHDWGGSIREAAIRQKLAIPDDAMESLCQGEHVSSQNPACRIPKFVPKLAYCPLFEYCEAFAFNAVVLEDRVVISRLIEATLNPCGIVGEQAAFQRACEDQKKFFSGYSCLQRNWARQSDNYPLANNPVGAATRGRNEAASFFGSSRNSGESGPDFEEEVGVVAVAVGHALDDLDTVVDALEDGHLACFLDRTIVALGRPRPQEGFHPHSAGNFRPFLITRLGLQIGPGRLTGGNQKHRGESQNQRA